MTESDNPLKGNEKLVEKVYDDALSPSARAVGESLGGAVRTALRPVDGVVWSLDQAFDWIGERVTKLLAHEKTPATEVIAPSIELEGRVLMSLQTAGPGDEVLRNMFAALIADAMRRDSSNHVHPGFVDVLRQITPEEARFFAIVGDRYSTIVRGHAAAMWQIESTFHDGNKSWASSPEGTPSIKHDWTNVWERYDLAFADGIAVSDALANLERSGAHYSKTNPFTDRFQRRRIAQPMVPFGS